jgi:hypothetical protein
VSNEGASPTLARSALWRGASRNPSTPKEKVTMNKTLSTLAAAVLAFSAIAVSAETAASAPGTNTPRIDQRQANQEKRIDQGIASGELTKREARRMNRQQNVIDKAENKAKADGSVSAQERRRLTQAQNQTSRNIYRQKHDAQDRKDAAKP